MQVWAHPAHRPADRELAVGGRGRAPRQPGHRQAMVRPGELNLMTAGPRHRAQRDLPARPAAAAARGAAVGCPARRRPGHGAALRDLRRAAGAVRWSTAGVRGTVLLGELDGVRSPADGAHADLRRRPDLDAGAAVTLDVGPGLRARGLRGRGRGDRRRHSAVAVDQLLYLGTGRTRGWGCAADQGAPGDPARRRAVRRGDRDVVELHRAQPRRDRRLPHGLGASRRRASRR